MGRFIYSQSIGASSRQHSEKGFSSRKCVTSLVWLLRLFLR